MSDSPFLAKIRELLGANPDVDLETIVDDALDKKRQTQGDGITDALTRAVGPSRYQAGDDAIALNNDAALAANLGMPLSHDTNFTN